MQSITNLFYTSFILAPFSRGQLGGEGWLENIFIFPILTATEALILPL